MSIRHSEKAAPKTTRSFGRACVLPLVTTGKAVLRLFYPGQRKSAPKSGSDENATLSLSIESTLDFIVALREPGVQSGPGLDPTTRATAVSATGMGCEEMVLGLIDTTVEGSGRCGLVFGLLGIYYHNNWSSRAPGSGFIPYEELIQRDIRRHSWSDVSLGIQQFLDRSCAQISSKKITEILQEYCKFIST